jgi:hypothetical protein
MTTFTSSVSGSATGPNGSKSWTINDADYANCLNYLQARYTTRDGGVPTKAQALTMYQQESITALQAQTKLWMDQQQALQINNPPPVFT